MIRVVLPAPLRILAGIDGELALDVNDPVTQGAVLDALEGSYPVLQGTMRDRATRRRRPFIRFYAVGLDISGEPEDTPLPEAVTAGSEPFIILGAIAGG